MFGFSKISFAIGLRLFLVAPVFVFTNQIFSVSEIRGQVPERRAVQASQLNVAPQHGNSLPNFFTMDEVAPAAPSPSLGQAKPVVHEYVLPLNWTAPAAPSLSGSQTPFSQAPSGSQARSGSPAPSGSPAIQTIQENVPPLHWDAPVNSAVTHYSNPAVNYQGHGMVDNNSIPHAGPPVGQTVNNEVVPLGNSYFESPAMNQQIIADQNTTVLPSVPPIFTHLANRNSNDSGLLSAYQSRSILQSNDQFQTPQSSHLPQGYEPWWAQQNKNPIGIKTAPAPVSLDSLIQRALKNSPHIQVAATQPHIQQTVLLEESSRFDWSSFLESTYDDQNEPVGNTLTLGNNDTRLQQREWFAEGGIRRQTRTGGEFELSQRFGTLDNNSQFLLPPDQGTSRIVLNYRQPLLRGRGQAVNESLIVLANINLNAASDEFLSNIQQHLTDLTETYWELVRARSELLQRNQLLIAAEKILNQLEGRSEVDALERQIFRARSAVAKRKAEIARSITSVKNAESRIRLLVNDQEIINAAGMELVPVDTPNLEHLGINLGDAISTALSNRPDISRSIREIKSTSVQLGISRNDLLPKLDLLVGSYVAGLDDQFDIAGAWKNQFSSGRPGFNVGFEFETQIGNRAAQARQSRREWEANRAIHQFRAVVESGLTEVELAVREVQTAHQEMLGRYHAMIAAQKESSFLTDRWETLPDENDSVILLLENLLDSQERLVDEEAAFSKAQFDYSVAVVKLKQATGILFQVN